MLRRALIVASILASAAVAPSGASVSTLRSFPCHWNYDMYVGLHKGAVSGGESADCAGVGAKLTLSARLFGWSSRRHRWLLERAVTRSWTNPTGNLYVEVIEPCRPGKNRAVYTWLLRDHSGRLIAHQVIRTAAVSDPGPNCAYVLR